MPDDPDDTDATELLAQVVEINSKCQNSIRQLAGRGMKIDPGQMALLRLNCLIDMTFGPVDLEGDKTTVQRLLFERQWLTNLLSMNNQALLAPPPDNNQGPKGPGGLHLP